MLSESDSLTLKPFRSGSVASAVGAEAFNPFELAMLMDCFKILAGRGPARSCEGEGLRGACEGDVSSEEELSRPSKSSSPDGGACEGPAGARACEGEGEGGACEGPARARACEGEGEGEGAAGESESQSTTSFSLAISSISRESIFLTRASTVSKPHGVGVFPTVRRCPVINLGMI